MGDICFYLEIRARGGSGGFSQKLTVLETFLQEEKVGVGVRAYLSLHILLLEKGNLRPVGIVRKNCSFPTDTDWSATVLDSCLSAAVFHFSLTVITVEYLHSS